MFRACIKNLLLLLLLLILLNFFFIQSSLTLKVNKVVQEDFFNTYSNPSKPFRELDLWRYTETNDLPKDVSILAYFQTHVDEKTIQNSYAAYQSLRRTLLHAVQQFKNLPIPLSEQQQKKIHELMFHIDYNTNYAKHWDISFNLYQSMKDNDVHFLPYFFKDETMRQSLKSKSLQLETLLTMKELPKELTQKLALVLQQATNDSNKQTKKSTEPPTIQASVATITLEVHPMEDSFRFGFEPVMDLTTFYQVCNDDKQREKVFISTYQKKEKAMFVYAFLEALEEVVHERLLYLVFKALLQLKQPISLTTWNPPSKDKTLREIGISSNANVNRKRKSKVKLNFVPDVDSLKEINSTKRSRLTEN